MKHFNELDNLAINTIRTLSIDAIEKANSGHPGLPMGAAPMAYILWTKHMNHNPINPLWFNRDRFILSAGHGSMLLYSLLHLSGYELSMEEIKHFRQWGSKTPGHPEFRHTPGVEATTGPLGQGIAMAVGMAMAERQLATQYNKENYDLINHYTYCICGDGDIMEGVSAEAASLAGHLKLGKLIVLYDSNDISLDGDLHQSLSESVVNRFDAYGWQVLQVEDGNNLEDIHHSIEEAKRNLDCPSIIEVKTTIGYGSPNLSGTSQAHGAPLGKDELSLTKQAYNWEYEEDFFVPKEVYAHFHTNVVTKGTKQEAKWNRLCELYKEEYSSLYHQLENSIKGKLPEDWEGLIPSYDVGTSIATRSSSGEVLNAIAKAVPFFFGGSADLAGSNKTTIENGGNFSANNYAGRNIWFGVREFAMGAILNGLVLHGGLKVYGGTFFVFSDYLRPAIRLAALMELPVTYVFTHDSIAVGEDGPTHQPIEQLASLRALPNLCVIRPADSNETAAAWKLALKSIATPTALVLTRQNLPTLTTNEMADTFVKRGAYVISKSDNPQGLIIASGSEVHLAIQAQQVLRKEGVSVSVISFPSWELFETQSKEYKSSVFPPNIKIRLALEMGASLGWHRYVGEHGQVLAIDQFGASGPEASLLEKFGFTVERIVLKVKELLKEVNE
ncbi:transketolase [Niallia alba]|uniref:transketolase n=1 Tax=Niallia alba TaxID=2729105 RepID=UPI0039A1D351